ncbi:MAG TPA: GGDEF domain-containing protein [Desulfobacteraceae bacterium]|nr:GGDEF domain-containing protein [Desulfobacteraceae bacterium]|tara:strand:+ start:1304 stop:2041 length:738 start_codon:yes stop_codon:yes gene_type:complete
MTHLEELNTIILNIIKAESYEAQLEAGKELFAFTVRKDVDDEIRELAENIAMLMIQKEGRELHLEFLFQDLKAADEDLYNAKHDPLTGLPNRALFYETLARHFDECKKRDKKAALIIIDLDKFKPVNDTYGHDAGDRLLKAVAERLQIAVGKRGYAARLGGDEFVVLFPEPENENEVHTIVRNILLSIKKPFDLKEGLTFIDSSIGISFLESSMADPGAWLKRADHAMYGAKKAGRGRYVVYSKS